MVQSRSVVAVFARGLAEMEWFAAAFMAGRRESPLQVA
jgi:hypothetical protein